MTGRVFGGVSRWVSEIDDSRDASRREFDTLVFWEAESSGRDCDCEPRGILRQTTIQANG